MLYGTSIIEAISTDRIRERRVEGNYIGSQGSTGFLKNTEKSLLTTYLAFGILILVRLV